MQRVDRLDLLIRILRDRPGITVAALARELSVSARSVFRDLDHLRERGYPIEADRGVAAGFGCTRAGTREGPAVERRGVVYPPEPRHQRKTVLSNFLI